MQATRDDGLFNEIHRLVTACLEDVATAETVKLLDELVSDDPGARSLYLQYLRDSIGLRYVVLPREEKPVGIVALAADADTGISSDSSLGSSPQVPSLAPAVPGNLWHGAVGYFSSGWPLAYLIATVVFGIGLLVGSHVYVSQPAQVARQSVPLPSSLSPVPLVVGRITAMVDCQWVRSPEPGVQSPALDSRLSTPRFSR